LESTYKYYDKHHIEDKVLEFGIGWTFYFATELRSEVSNPEEFNKLKTGYVPKSKS
jgi:hypothetical protein